MSFIGSSDATVSFNIFRNNHATYTGGLMLDAAGTLYLKNNLFTGNIADLAVGAATIEETGSHAYIINNTVVANVAGSADGIGGLQRIGSGEADISNNIFWANTGGDLTTFNLSGGSAVLRNNDYGTLQNNGPPADASNLADPRFAAANDFHLRADSPLINAGIDAPPGGLPTNDIEGHARNALGGVDIGAYERGDELFDDDFE